MVPAAEAADQEGIGDTDLTEQVACLGYRQVLF
jgi:hypothetical protein